MGERYESICFKRGYSGYGPVLTDELLDKAIDMLRLVYAVKLEKERKRKKRKACR